VGPKQLTLPPYREVVEHLQKLKQRGISCVVFRGNRDSFLEERFQRAAQCRLGDDFAVLTAGEQEVVLTPGDLLCTRDRNYQRLRKFLRSKPVSWVGPRLPLRLSMGVGKWLRRHSQNAVARKYPAEKSLAPAAVATTLVEKAADVLICGHVHERREESIPLQGREGKLLVLPPFGPEEPILVFDERFHFLAQAPPFRS